MSNPTNSKPQTERPGDNDSRPLRKGTAEARKKTATPGGITDAAMARIRFERTGYLTKDQPVTICILATMARQLSLETANEAKASGLCALAYLLEEWEEEETGRRITEAVIAKVTEGLAQIPAVEALEAAAREFGEAASKAAGALDEFKEDCSDLMQRLSDAADEISQAVPTPTETETPTANPMPEKRATMSYAHIAQQGATYEPQSTSSSPRNNRQILVDRAPNATTHGLQDLCEKDLVAKANMALILMNDDGEGVPERAEFVGAQKLRHGGVLYRLNLDEGAEWVRTEGMAGFLEKMGGTLVVRERTVTIVVEYVPISFDPNAVGDLRGVEEKSGLPKDSIVKATYMKPIHR